MSQYRTLIEKLSKKNTDRCDFDELCIVSKNVVNELTDADRERLEKHMCVILALALNKNKGSVDNTEECLKTLEKQVSSPEVSFSVKQSNHTVYPEPVRKTGDWTYSHRFIVYIMVFLFIFLFVILPMSIRK